MTTVTFAPDYRQGNSYQQCLASALTGEGFQVGFMSTYRRGLPLARADRHGTKLLHLHWPEAYFASRHDAFDLLRRLRFPLDLRLAVSGRPLVYTAHNFLPHASHEGAAVKRAYFTVLRNASAVIAHSAASVQVLAEFCPSAASRIHVIPHGDAAEGFPPLPTREGARQRLAMSSVEKVALMFGRIEPYKGVEEIINAWPRMPHNATLLLAGETQTSEYAHALQAQVRNHPRIRLHLERLSDTDLAEHLAAADVVLFNYRRIFTSGSACLARSLGKKILLPARLSTLDLMEPAPTVFRFESVMSDLPHILRRAVDASEDPAGTAKWRTATSWQRVARQTAAIYREVLGQS